MDFEFSPDQELLRETVRRFLGERAPVRPYVRAQLETRTGTSAEVWAGWARLGVLGLVVPEEHGGAGMGMVDLAVVLEEMGRCVHPGPFRSSALAAPSVLTLAGSTDAQATYLPGIADGSVVAAVALPDRRDAPPVVARAVGRTGWELSGVAHRVADAAAADVVLVAARCGEELGVYAIEPGASVEIVDSPTVDPTRREAIMTFAGARARRLGEADASAAIEETRDRLMVAAVVDGVGAAEQALTLAVDYARERRQFGRPIGSFQAVQHLCAEMLQLVELGRAAAYYACWACDAADARERRRAVTIAAAFACDGFYRVGASSIQVFGGVGFTWEHDVHLFYKRLLTLQLYGGSPHEHLEHLAELILD